MASLDKPSPLTTTVKWRFPSVHPEGRKFVLVVAVAVLLSYIFLWDIVTYPLIALAVFVAAFFRDPIRVTPKGEGLVVSPADGLITMIERVAVPREMAGDQALGVKPM